MPPHSLGAGAGRMVEYEDGTAGYVPPSKLVQRTFVCESPTSPASQ